MLELDRSVQIFILNTNLTVIVLVDEVAQMKEISAITSQRILCYLRIQQELNLKTMK